MKSKNTDERTPHISQGNVLDDIGFSPGEVLEIQVKADLYRDLLRHIRNRGFTQKQLAGILEIHQPDASNLLNGRISKFSVGKLIKFAGKLNLAAEVKITELPSAGRSGATATKAKTRKRLAIA